MKPIDIVLTELANYNTWRANTCPISRISLDDYTVATSTPTIEIYIPPHITNVIFNNPATIVFWSDSTKTVVKCSDEESYDPEKGLAMCIAKKMFGNKGNYYNKIRKWLKNA